ncbi:MULTISPECIES: oxygenase MpaB family protein [Gordonia]|uniref:Oxygenase MpaB family protein n=1 Tax=Gordonia amicalis TaxID=89053 RepID=A0AAE4R5W8_9ACTN|nr:MULTISPECIES: oxygenase MpaB family protein [Gordonia]ATD72451.1 TetR family transcriptional regulator [Gordonia sp. 1D]MCZ4652589.1 oxygenase MpaB family protein [Gordonia amicalis]MDJ0454657.1 oxygenase MpaB family protein [Gordonia amicalis]MDV6309348.1 oxygenase MpaB family protein [Gordonia amicalis]MDV6313689.1 oxygenase MpaB family protein [Gordonia amicalis]
MKRIPSDLVNADLAVQRYGEAGRVWLDQMWLADPLTDAVAADSHPGGSTTSVLRNALAHGISSLDESTDSMRALFAFLDDEPAWADHDRMARAADALIVNTAPLGIVLGAASLVRGAGNTIAAKPLAITGRYVSQPAMRSVEVGEWLSQVITPGGMRRDGDGFAYTVRVRMIHAHVRQMLWKRGDWDEKAWGVPIPQPYMAFTIAEFGHIAIAAMHTLGVRFTDRELEDIYHLWRYVGHVVGMSPELNPSCEADHVRIEELYRLTSPGPGPDDHDFVVALTEDYLVPELANVLPGPRVLRNRLATNIMYGLQRVFIGDHDADALGIPDGTIKHVLGRVGPALALAGSAQRRGGARRARARIEKAYRVRDAEMARMRVDYRVGHGLVDAATNSASSGQPPVAEPATQPPNSPAAVTSSVRQ